jgi:hypothetical protein
MRQMIAGFDMSPTVGPDDVHASHMIENDSAFFVWPKCRSCAMDAVNQGYLLTLPCQGPRPMFREEDVLKQHAIILQRNKDHGKTVAVSRSNIVTRIKSFFVSCFIAYAKAMAHYRH